MPATDPYVLTSIQFLLLVFTAFALIRDIRIRILERRGGLAAEVVRGEPSMTPLYTVYAGALASCLVLIDKAPFIDGYRVSLIALNFLCLTYLFFFSTWFRNAVFFRIAARVRKD